LFPQCPANDSWAYFENKLDLSTGNYTDWRFPFKPAPTAVTSSLLKLIDRVLENDSIDRSRVYIAGISQGGMGVLDIIARKPEIFAAAISICGAGDPATSKLFAGKTALWLFHGDKDQVVPPVFSEQFYRKLKRANANVRFTEYPGIEHNSWSKAFAEPDLMRWLFNQTK
jgi:predicted peptidase